MISYIFPPLGGSGAQRSLKFAKYLPGFDWRPTIISASNASAAKDDSLLADIPEQATVVRIPSWDPHALAARNKSSQETKSYTTQKGHQINIFLKIRTLLGKMFASLTSFILIPDSASLWIIPAYITGKKIIRQNNISAIYSTSEPFSSHIVGLLLKRKFNKPWICDFRDEWTTNPFRNYPTIVHKIINQWIERKILNRADRVISVTEPITTSLNKLATNQSRNKFVTITNGYDETDFMPLPQKNKHQAFTIAYTGSMYGTISPITLLQALSELIREGRIPDNKIKLVFAGQIGTEITSHPLFRWAQNISLVEVNGYVKHFEAVKIMYEADSLLLIISNQRSDNTYTGKIFEYLAVGRPIIALIPPKGVAAKLIQDSQTGVVINPDDIKGIKNAILHYYQRWAEGRLMIHAQQSVVRSFTRKNLTFQLAKLLDNATKK